MGGGTKHEINGVRLIIINLALSLAHQRMTEHRFTIQRSTVSSVPV